MISITEVAAGYLKNLLKENNKENSYLRVMATVSCCGLKYGLAIDDLKKEDDLFFESNGIKIIVDPNSYDFLKGSEIDFVKDEIFGEGFKINNPEEIKHTKPCSCDQKECGCN